MTSRRGPKREHPGMTWPLRSLCWSSAKCALTHHPQTGGGTAYGSRALFEGGPLGVPSLPVWTGLQTPPAACASGRAALLPRGFGGRWTPTSCAGYILEHCLPVRRRPAMGGEHRLTLCYALKSHFLQGFGRGRFWDLPGSAWT